MLKLVEELTDKALWMDRQMGRLTNRQMDKLIVELTDRLDWTCFGIKL